MYLFSDMQERYNTLKEKYKETEDQKLKSPVKVGPDRSIYLDKSLSATLDSFDNLFCRRCLVRDFNLFGLHLTWIE